MVHVKARRLRGFALTEVLAICAMVLLVLIVLAPTIQVARDRARMLRCRNNLKQLGLALHYYDDVYLRFAPGYVVRPKVGKDGALDLDWNSGWGWQAAILPFIDQAPLYNMIDHSKGLPTAADKVVGKKIPTYLCNDDKGSATVAKVAVLGPLPGGRQSAIVEKGFGRSNYVGVAGWDNDWHLGTKAPDNPNAAADDKASNWSTLELGHDFRDGIMVYNSDCKLKDKTPVPNARDYGGIFGENSSRKMRDLTDGASNIIVVGERATPTKSDSETDVGNTIWAGVPDRSTRVGQSMSLGSAYWPVNYEVTADKVPNTSGFNSRHGDGANFLFADGAVRSVSDKLDLALLRRLAMIADGTTGEVKIPAVP